ncbi:hypothetical protein ILYODFUR_033488 [Ilyodon furcidens]|uniref:Uncharacterized protein n=1 Tax=Ilyodon furcidens TaxID=33524 RepID=A0ABV0UNF7_9TELE
MFCCPPSECGFAVYLRGGITFDDCIKLKPSILSACLQQSTVHYSFLKGHRRQSEASDVFILNVIMRQHPGGFCRAVLNFKHETFKNHYILFLRFTVSLSHGPLETSPHLLNSLVLLLIQCATIICHSTFDMSVPLICFSHREPAEMSVTMAKSDAITVFTIQSDPQSRWPPVCQILKNLCYNPMCCSVSQDLRKIQRKSHSVLGVSFNFHNLQLCCSHSVLVKLLLCVNGSRITQLTCCC